MKPRSILRTTTGWIALCALDSVAFANHPQLLVTADRHDAIVQKTTTVDWATAAFSGLRERIDPLVAQTAADPQWATSRMAMNWDTHYTQAITEQSR
ncbi:hypothetical protein, partial [Pontiella sp.]|uniref:hypothetical protein n=1 Tax=Pontiella sp. TaxID=2837462 RepID=UPI0035632635